MSNTSTENCLNQITCNLFLNFHTKIKQKKKRKKGLRGNKFVKIHRVLVTIDLPSVSVLKQFSFSSSPFSLYVLECRLPGVSQESCQLPSQFVLPFRCGSMSVKDKKENWNIFPLSLLRSFSLSLLPLPLSFTFR